MIIELLVSQTELLSYVLERFCVVFGYVLERFLVLFDYVLEKKDVSLHTKYNNQLMYQRTLIHQLRKWSLKKNHKPLVIRGARPH